MQLRLRCVFLSALSAACSVHLQAVKAFANNKNSHRISASLDCPSSHSRLSKPRLPVIVVEFIVVPCP